MFLDSFSRAAVNRRSGRNEEFRSEFSLLCTAGSHGIRRYLFTPFLPPVRAEFSEIFPSRVTGKEDRCDTFSFFMYRKFFGKKAIADRCHCPFQKSLPEPTTATSTQRRISSRRFPVRSFFSGAAKEMQRLPPEKSATGKEKK